MTTPRHWLNDSLARVLADDLGFTSGSVKAEGIEMTLAREMIATARGNLSASGRHREVKDLDFRAVTNGGSANYPLMANEIGYALGEPDSRLWWLQFLKGEGASFYVVPGVRLFWSHEEAFSPLPYWEWRVVAVLAVWLVANKRDDTEVRDDAAKWLYRETAMWCLGAAPRIEVDGYKGPGYAGCGLRCERTNGRVGMRSINPLMSYLLGFEAQEPWGAGLETHKMAREVRWAIVETLDLPALILLMPWTEGGLRAIRDDIGDTRLACNIEVRWYQRGEELLVLSCVIGGIAGRQTGGLWLGAVESGKPSVLHEVYPYSSDRVRGKSGDNPELEGWSAEFSLDGVYRVAHGDPDEPDRVKEWEVPPGYTLMLRAQLGPDAAPLFTGHWADAFLGGQPAPSPPPKPVPVPTPPAGDREALIREIRGHLDAAHFVLDKLEDA